MQTSSIIPGPSVPQTAPTQDASGSLISKSGKPVSVAMHTRKVEVSMETDINDLMNLNSIKYNVTMGGEPAGLLGLKPVSVLQVRPLLLNTINVKGFRPLPQNEAVDLPPLTVGIVMMMQGDGIVTIYCAGGWVVTITTAETQIMSPANEMYSVATMMRRRRGLLQETYGGDGSVSCSTGLIYVDCTGFYDGRM